MATREKGGVTPIVRDGVTRWWVRFPIAGRRKSLGIYDDEAVALAVLEAAREKYAEAPGGLTLATYGDDYLDGLDADELHRSVGDMRSIFRARIATAPFARWPMRRIGRTDVVRWVKTQLREPPRPGKGQAQREGKTARRTVQNALNVLRCMLRAAADEGHIASNPAEGVKVPRVPTEAQEWTFLELAEIARVLALPIAPPRKRPKGSVSAKQHAAITVSIYTGLRQGELWGLRWCDAHLDGDRPRLVVCRSYDGPTKGGRVREVPLLPAALEALRAWRRAHPGVGEALVFPGAGGELHAEGYDAGWARVRRLAGVRSSVRWHDLRHTCASHLVMGSWGQAWRLEEVRDMLGHQSITTTERYAHLAPGRLHDLARETRGREQER